MIGIRKWWAVVGLALLTACGADSTRSDDDDATCGVTGSTQNCVCPGSDDGAQTCQADGTWSTCVCAGGDVGLDDVSADVGSDVAVDVDPQDTGSDASSDVDPDTAADVGEDAQGDATDASEDAPSDAPVDTPSDPPVDAPSDVGEDVSVDADGGDVSMDTGADVGMPCMDSTACDPGSFCGAAGRCVASECSDFFDDVSCGMGSHCVPETADANRCVEDGLGVEGAACADQEDCGAGTLCVGETCLAPDCGTDGTPSCGGGAECVPLTFDETPLDFGFCILGCEAFSPDACPAGQWCSPSERDGMSGRLQGQCVDRGDGMIAEGEACEPGGDPCVDGSLCLTAGDGTSLCRALCDPESEMTGVGACADGQSCLGLNAGGEALDFGACFPSCTPYVDPMVSGCDSGEWCFPSGSTPDAGQCVPQEGTAREAELCGADYDRNGSVDPYETCSVGTFCLGVSATESRCVIACDPSATPADAGHCSNVSDHLVCSCGTLVQNMDTLAFGSVQEGCSYVHGGAEVSCDTWGTCSPGELFGAMPGQDICSIAVPETSLSEFDDCVSAGLAEGDLCSPNGVCLVIEALGGPDVLCYELCMTTEGAFNTSSHPDCSRDSASCSQVFTSDVFGICGPDA